MGLGNLHVFFLVHGKDVVKPCMATLSLFDLSPFTVHWKSQAPRPHQMIPNGGFVVWIWVPLRAVNRDLYGSVWICMDMYGYVWIYIYIYIWIYLDIYDQQQLVFFSCAQDWPWVNPQWMSQTKRAPLMPWMSTFGEELCWWYMFYICRTCSFWFLQWFDNIDIISRSPNQKNWYWCDPILHQLVWFCLLLYMQLHLLPFARKDFYVDFCSTSNETWTCKRQ